MFSNDFIRILVVFLYVFLVPVEAWCHEDAIAETPGVHHQQQLLPTTAVEIRIPDVSMVGADQILLGDVATIYSKSISDFKKLSALVVSKMPSDSEELKIPLVYLQSRVSEVLGQNVEFAIRAPKEIVFRKEDSQPVHLDFSSKLIALAKKHIPENVLDIEVEILSGKERLPNRIAKIEPIVSYPDWKGDMTFKVYPEGDGAFCWVRAKIKWFQDAWIAKDSVRPYESLRIENFQKERVETTQIKEALFLAADSKQLREQFTSSRARRGIRPGSVLTASMAERRPDLMTGSKVRVRFVSEGGLQVTADGVSVGMGRIGDSVRAKLRTSKKIITGKLISDGLVEVSL